jgi:hypothetical protein
MLAESLWDVVISYHPNVIGDNLRQTDRKPQSARRRGQVALHRAAEGSIGQ